MPTRASRRNRLRRSTPQLHESEIAGRVAGTDRILNTICPVCMIATVFEKKFDGNYQLQNALCCTNNHGVCLSCLPRLEPPYAIQDVGQGPGGQKETGFVYKCPECKLFCGLRREHVLAVITGKY